VLGRRAVRPDRGATVQGPCDVVLAVLGREDRRRHREWDRVHARGRLRGAAAVPDRLRRHLRAVLHARRDPAAPPLPEARVSEFPWLSWIIFFPLGGAVLLMLLPEGAGKLIRRWAATVAIAEFAFSLPLWWRLVPGAPQWQFAEQRVWIPSLGASYHLGADGISALLVLLTTVT